MLVNSLDTDYILRPRVRNTARAFDVFFITHSDLTEIEYGNKRIFWSACCSMELIIFNKLGFKHRFVVAVKKNDNPRHGNMYLRGICGQRRPRSSCAIVWSRPSLPAYRTIVFWIIYRNMRTAKAKIWLRGQTFATRLQNHSPLENTYIAECQVLAENSVSHDADLKICKHDRLRSACIYAQCLIMSLEILAHRNSDQIVQVRASHYVNTQQCKMSVS